jgi:hypothetical protein
MWKNARPFRFRIQKRLPGYFRNRQNFSVAIPNVTRAPNPQRRCVALRTPSRWMARNCLGRHRGESGAEKGMAYAITALMAVIAMANPKDPEHRRQGPRVETPTFRVWRRGGEDPESKELAELEQREEMLRRAAQRMLDEADRLHKQADVLRGRQVPD